MVLNRGQPTEGRLSMDRVDLWWEDIDSRIQKFYESWETLSKDERDRAERFRFDRHRERFILQRGMLRKILSSYGNVPPGAIRFRKGPGGKPELTGNNPKIRFNLSHSGGHALYAIAYGREVGVDVEVIRPKMKAATLVERFFSPNEKRAFRKIEPAQKTTAFFSGWTRKEAYVKALGKGLRFPLNRFDVSLKPGDQEALLRVEGAPEELMRWSLQNIDLGPGFSAALAVAITNPFPIKNISIRFRRYAP